MTNGPELRAFRRFSGVTVTAVARVLGVSRQTVHAIENRFEVDDLLADRYVAAVKALATAKGSK